MLKRAIPALVAIGVALAAVSPAQAASVTKSGAVKMTWNVAVNATLALFTQYTEASALAQGSGVPNLQPSSAGVCAGSGSETAFNLTFGALNASAAAVGCNYKDAIGALVNTNSSSWVVTEYLDASPTPGINFCVFKDALTDTTGKGPASPNASAPAAYSGSCAAGGALLPAGSAAAGSAAGNPGTASLRTATPPGAPFTWYTGAAATAASGTALGEDIQINLGANQASSTADSNFVLITLVAS